jgi:hypothetical protein
MSEILKLTPVNSIYRLSKPTRELLERRSWLDRDVIGDIEDEDEIKPIRCRGECEDA